MNFKPNNLSPVWHFLTQPVFDVRRPLILNPRRFWNHYRINHLERCWITTFHPGEHHRY